jgi:hypothetical protein
VTVFRWYRIDRAVAAALVLYPLLTAMPTQAQQRGDPIGPIARTATFDRGKHVDVGRTASGKTVCYFREEGSSHRLDIGMIGGEAFIRLEAPDQHDVVPATPVLVFAGKPKANGDYQALQQYAGGVQYTVPDPARGNFVLIAKGDAKDDAKHNAGAFLGMVARARGEFVVVQSAAKPKDTDIVAIYKFTAASIPALLSCGKAQTR